MEPKEISVTLTWIKDAAGRDVIAIKGNTASDHYDRYAGQLLLSVEERKVLAELLLDAVQHQSNWVASPLTEWVVSFCAFLAQESGGLSLTQDNAYGLSVLLPSPVFPKTGGDDEHAEAFKQAFRTYHIVQSVDAAMKRFFQYLHVRYGITVA